MKTQEELNALKKEVEALNKKLEELTEEELKTVTGGGHCGIYIGGGSMIHAPVFGKQIIVGDIKPEITRSWFSTANENNNK